MKELIKEAEGLYLELSRITDSLVYARLHDDNDLLHGCRNELENFSQSVMQTLKCLVDSKDNIVDLGEVWHDISVEPRYDNKRLVFENKDGFITYCSNKSKALKIWNTWKNLSLGASVRWAYVDDLLPKGDNK